MKQIEYAIKTSWCFELQKMVFKIKRTKNYLVLLTIISCFLNFFTHMQGLFLQVIDC